MDGACLRCGRSDGRTLAGGVDCLDCRESGVRLSVCVQAHPARSELLRGLLLALAPANVLVAMAEESAKPNPLATYLTALRHVPAWASHHLVIQDDAEVCANFLAAAALAITARPEAPLCFFSPAQPPEMSHRIRCAADRGETFAVLPCRRWAPVVALCWPAALAEGFLAYVEEQRWPHHFRADDEAAGRYFRAEKIAVLATVPSLIEHPDLAPSLVGRRPRGGRVAANYIGAGDALDVLWR